MYAESRCMQILENKACFFSSRGVCFFLQQEVDFSSKLIAQSSAAVPMEHTLYPVGWREKNPRDGLEVGEHVLISGSASSSPMELLKQAPVLEQAQPWVEWGGWTEAGKGDRILVEPLQLLPPLFLLSTVPPLGWWERGSSWLCVSIVVLGQNTCNKYKWISCHACWGI